MAQIPVFSKLNSLALFILFIAFTGCSTNDNSMDTTDTSETTTNNNYNGTASVTQGLAATTITNLYPAGQRIAGLGSIVATDNTTWIVPAIVNYTDTSFPFAPDLYNPNGTQYTTAAEALAAFDVNNSVEIDTDGDMITAYIFSDNYFEIYINGMPVGKDAIPFTEFNSHIIKFKVSKPFTIAMKLVDWEENLGLGSEDNQGSAYHPGDGGMVAVFKDASGNTIATTGSEWKAQTYYTAPIKDLTCPSENGTTRSSANCNTDDVANGTLFYGLHWKTPTNWETEAFDDTAWPNATTYTNITIGVDNKIAYTNFTNIFDDPTNDAEFIWSTNVILDNEVLVRYTVQ